MALTYLNKSSRVLDQLIVSPPLTPQHKHTDCHSSARSETNEKHDRDHSATGRKDEYPCTLCDTVISCGQLLTSWTATITQKRSFYIGIRYKCNKTCLNR